MSEFDPKVIVALDYPTADQARALVSQLSSQLCKLKIGKELFTIAGPDLVREFVDLGYDVFLDLKFHDIPNTVNKAVAAACNLGVWMVNVHALGGSAMMQAAAEAVTQQPGGNKTKLIAVSVLTSTLEEDLRQLGIQKNLQQMVLDLTALALSSGLDGMVCSAQEVTMLRQEFGADPLLVTPGIRPAGSSKDDQSRILTPEQAIEAGSSYLVIGRPITQSENPVATLKRINQDIMITVKRDY